MRLQGWSVRTKVSVRQPPSYIASGVAMADLREKSCRS